MPKVEVPGQPPVNFDHAAINLFSQFGTWVCAPTPNRNDCLPASSLDRGAVSFGADADPNHIDPVELTIDEDGNTSVQGFSSPPCAAAGGLLGDDSSVGPGREAFRFKGEAGEKITVTLAPSRSGGGAGKTARLVLRDAGGRRLAADAGALPLKLVATLPAAGNYVVAAIKARRSIRARHSGGTTSSRCAPMPARHAASRCCWERRGKRSLRVPPGVRAVVPAATRNVTRR